YSVLNMIIYLNPTRNGIKSKQQMNHCISGPKILLIFKILHFLKGYPVSRKLSTRYMEGAYWVILVILLQRTIFLLQVILQKICRQVSIYRITVYHRVTLTRMVPAAVIMK